MRKAVRNLAALFFGLLQFKNPLHPENGGAEKEKGS